ncbi:MAG: gliding motility-associated C-terminal domain-containing protein [Flavobacteriaceae bacterium]|nr:gliding motility-associated C-terminal domain-containing protein [Flavobacteriaceae bacterium]
MENIIKDKTGILKLIIILLITNLSFSQISNEGDFIIDKNTVLSSDEDLSNDAGGVIISDGNLYLYNHFINNGKFSYSIANNQTQIRFVGSDTQNISGIGINEFYNILFDNSGYGFDLSSDINIDNSAVFTQGILNNHSLGGNIIFGINANISPSSYRSYTNGIVIKKGNSEFEFPIGDKDYYRPIKISTSNDVMNVFTAKYHFENSNTQYPHSSTSNIIEFISDTEYWTINNTLGDANIMLTLSLDNDSSPRQILDADSETLCIVRWDSDSNMWVDQGGVVSGDYITAPIDKFGVFTLAISNKENMLTGGVVVYNTISPNNDGMNDFFFIDGIAKYPENTLKIFNRWGASVYETNGYNETDNVFRGSNKSNILPNGTYFYSLTYNHTESSVIISKSGYLYLNK